ncbi:STR6 [Symbiodinium sp. CCMP2592]|nr:STR6 [Symbiodinium sp. CCMP2592]
MGPIWEVVGGLQRGGLLVRIGKDTSSEPLADRLQTGAFVRQLEKDGDRLCYELLFGQGPQTGWISCASQGKPLLAARSDLWEVVGGGEKGGLLVRRGRDLTSEALEERLATGSWVKELEPPKDGRLHFARLAGSGPEEGYVSLQVGGKELLKKAASHQAAIPAAPSSAPSAPSSRKLRIFALAGSITCKELLKFQCGQLAALLGKDAVEWTYAEGTVFHPWELSEQLSDFERTVAGKRQQLISWYEDIYHCKQDEMFFRKTYLLCLRLGPVVGS